MKIILENELEKRAWEIMMAAHYKWEKNNGSELLGQMEWYFNDLFKDETKEMINQEVETRLLVDYGHDGLDVIGVSEEEYVRKGLDNYKDDGLTEQYLAELKADFIQEYRDIVKDCETTKEYLQDEVELDLYKIYHTFFCAPEILTVEYNGEIIQQDK